jgi:hypothetical protein
MESDHVRQLRERLSEKPLIVLCREPNPNQNLLDVQDYVINAENVIPIFSSHAALKQSLRGGDLGRPVYAISRSLLAQVLKGDEVLLLDPTLPSQMRFTAAQYREAFPEPFTWPSDGNAE